MISGRNGFGYQAFSLVVLLSFAIAFARGALNSENRLADAKLAEEGHSSLTPLQEREGLPHLVEGTSSFEGISASQRRRLNAAPLRTRTRTRRPPVRRPTRTRTPWPARRPSVSDGWNPKLFRYTILPGEFVYFPTTGAKHYPDFAAVDLHLPNKQIRVYSGKGKTDLIVNGKTLHKKLEPKFRINVNWRPPAYYTTVLEAVAHDDITDLVHGWVHIETWTGDMGASWFHGEITYTRSRDGGVNWSPATFTMADYVVSSAGPYFNNRISTGTGAHWVVATETYYYMYYVDMWAEWPTAQNGRRYRPGRCIARSTRRCEGKPGCWRKLYRGAYTEPGVRFGEPQNRQGLCSAIADIYGTSVTRVCTDNTNECFYANIPPSFVGWVGISRDGSDWDRMDGNWFVNLTPRTAGERAVARSWYQGYQSILKDENDRYWLYAFMTSAEYNDYRAIVRYQISFDRAGVPGCGGRIMLAKYNQGVRTRATFQPIDTREWRKTADLGYVSVCYGRGLVRLVDCISVNSGQHFLTREGRCRAGRNAPDGSRTRFAGPGGQVLTVSKPGTIALYQCYIRARNSYDYSVGQACSPVSELLGYIMPPRSDWSNGGLADSGEDPFYDAGYNYTFPEDDSLWDKDLLQESRAELLREAQDQGLLPDQLAAASSGMNPAIIAIATVVPVLAVVGLVIAAVIIIRRRRSAEYEAVTSRSSSVPSTPARTPKGHHHHREMAYPRGPDSPTGSERTTDSSRTSPPSSPEGTPGRTKEVVGLPPLRVAWFEAQSLFPQVNNNNDEATGPMVPKKDSDGKGSTGGSSLSGRPVVL
mmetsp:Transcript_39268/g.63680  ORF Transcript_39268/g.63680 Transcript_39268/m.63680 type:complete len:815 (+) Transcript_39268:2218-4662(+)